VYLRSLKHKERRKFKKKEKVSKWKRLRKSALTKAYMIKYAGFLVSYSQLATFNIYLKGTPVRWKKILKYFLVTRDDSRRIIFKTQVPYIFIKNPYQPEMSRRAIKKRIAKRIHLQR
jgi:hypothetical protein